ncbi:MAG: DUF2993 domain-containing protein [Nitriliruptorales bacterium]|nr:DUF2993 domain-containing protein [Nitriliruptorales bacterium]
MRRLGCLVVVLLVLGVGFYVADAAATTYGEERTEQRLARAYDTEADVDFDGWPVSARVLLTGSIPRADISAVEVPLDNGATIDDLRVTLTDVSVRLDDLRSGRGRRLPPAAEGTFRATLGERSVAALLGMPADLVTVTLERDVVEIAAGEFTVTADVEARDGDVVVAVQGPLAALVGGSSFPIDLSSQPGSPAAEEIIIRDGRMVVRGTLEDVRR